jgi:squalene-hopene/tetraprenyl-beta-curcumene cyclase
MRLKEAIQTAALALLRHRQADGHWVFPLEADATIPADYVLLQHYLGRIDDRLNARIAAYLRRIQAAEGGWPQYPGGAFDLSVSVKTYFALKACGDPAGAPHMRRARAQILAAGGAERANTFARIQLALFGALPWASLPAMPVELMLLPRWFPITLWRMAYWSRTFIAPLVVLQALRPVARNPRRVSVEELMRGPAGEAHPWGQSRTTTGWSRLFTAADAVLRRLEPHWPSALRRRATDAAIRFVEERLNGEDGLGAIYPPMAYAVMMFDALGYGPDHPQVATAWRALRALVVEGDGEAYVQPCVSPVWDTALAAHALQAAAEAGVPNLGIPLAEARDWLAGREVTIQGDWSVMRPRLAPGGWAFQYRNAHYPDVDDTAVVALLLHRDGAAAHAAAVARARTWIVGMQGRFGGWGAFDADNDREVLNHIPFADHGALLDPPTADVTARCLTLLSVLDRPEDGPARAAALRWLREAQERDGSWFGRWGMNHIYGTWSVLEALRAAGVGPEDPAVARAAAWLRAVQRADGGWGEDARSYETGAYVEACESLPSQTSWAMLGLMAADRGDDAVIRGAGFLLGARNAQGSWDETLYNATGFPRVLSLKYHGYPKYFPILALARLAHRRPEMGDGLSDSPVEEAILPPLG